MDDDIMMEEQSLQLLKEQLSAVQHIRKELERKEQQIHKLKVQAAEAQSFRDQAISLRTQCRIYEEQVNLLEASQEQALGRHREREQELERRIRDAEEQRGALLEKLSDEQALLLEVEEAKSRAEHAKAKIQELEARCREQQMQLEGSEGKVVGLNGTIDGLRSALSTVQSELAELRPKHTEAQVLSERLQRQIRALEDETRQIPCLQRAAEQCETLQKRNLQLEKELILCRASVDSEKLSHGGVQHEVERLQALVARQERTLQQLETDGARAKGLQADVQLLTKSLKAVRSEHQEATAELCQLRKTERSCLGHVEGLLTTLSRLTRDIARDSSLQMLDTLFPNDHESMSESLVWSRLGCVRDELRHLLADLWRCQATTAQLEEQVAVGEAQRVTILAKLESTEAKLRNAETELEHARRSTEITDGAVGGLKSSLEELQSTTAVLQAETKERDAFLHELYSRLRSTPLSFEVDSTDGHAEEGDERSGTDFLGLQSAITIRLSLILRRSVELTEKQHRDENESERRDEESVQKTQAHAQQLAELQRAHEEELKKVVEASSLAERTMAQAMDKAAADGKQREQMLRAELERLEQKLEFTLRDARQQGERNATLLEDQRADKEWMGRAMVALQVLGEMNQWFTWRYRSLLAQKRFLHEQWRLSFRLQTDVISLALAVSGEYELPSHISGVTHRRLSGLAGGMPCFRGVVIAVLFAHRLLPKFRRRLIGSCAAPRLVDVPSSPHHVPVERRSLPAAEDLRADSLHQAARRVMKSLSVPDSDSRASQDIVLPQEESKTLLDLLARGQGAHARRLRDFVTQDETESALHQPASCGGGLCRAHVWDPSARWATQRIRAGLLTMSRSLAQLGQQLDDARTNGLAMLGRTEEQLHAYLEAQEAINRLNERITGLKEELSLSQAKVVSAENTAEQCKERLGVAHREGETMKAKVANAEARVAELELLLQSTRDAQAELADDVAKWRRLAQRCQQETTELRGGAQRVGLSLSRCVRDTPMSSRTGVPPVLRLAKTEKGVEGAGRSVLRGLSAEDGMQASRSREDRPLARGEFSGSWDAQPLIHFNTSIPRTP